MKRAVSFLCMLFLCLTALPLWAGADMGPKPQLTIRVENPPEGLYYLDLLIPADVRGSYDNLEEDGDYDAALLTGLHSWEDEGWYPAFAGGTKAPLFGRLTAGEDGEHRFTYYGLPQTFRIALSSADGAKATEASFTRSAFYTTLVYDWQSNAITHATPAWLAALVQFLATFLPTLLIEGALLLLFRFKLRENLVAFLVVNLVTQIGLHLVMGSGFVTLSSSFPFYLLLMLPAEAVIFAVEAAAYVFLLKGDGSRGRRVLYALTANLASCCAGFVALQPVLSLLKRL